jgi:putative membrane protein
MQFLKTLFWVVLAAALVLFARENWVPVTLNLWSGLQADVKLPFLVAIVFLLGFLPTYLILRGRIWTLRRRYEQAPRLNVANQPVSPAAVIETSPPAPPPAPDLTKPTATSAP